MSGFAERTIPSAIMACYTPSWVSIAVAIRFLDSTLGLLEAGGIPIAFPIRSLDRRGSLSQSLFIPLIAPYKLYFSNRFYGWNAVK